MELSIKLKICVVTAAFAIGCASVVYVILRHKRRYREVSDALSYMNIKIVVNEKVCDEVVGEIRSFAILRQQRGRRSVEHHAVGFDCEWVTTNGTRQAVALLQLSTLDGFCGLFRLNQMKTVPDSLKTLLEDNTIYKVGVAPTDDAKYLFQDYSAILKNSLDLRHLARLNGYNAGGLAALSQSLLRIVLDKNWKVRCSDWEVEQLTSSQIMYAAADAHIAIKLYATLINECRNKRSTFGWLNVNNKDVNELCCQYLDVPFKIKQNRHQNDNIYRKNENNSNTENPLVSKRIPHAVRSKPLYHNCFLQAPDGELLCTCDTKKARWYAAKGLAQVVQQEPLTVRLRFEPAGRSVGAVGRYYQLAKENKCVVCGSTDSYIRKNVVPREYRKYFPEVMKDHSSHDVVLLCARCHQRSNALDLAVREALAAACAAPLARAPRPLAGDPHKSVRSAARVLLYQTQKHALPAARRAELTAALRDHFAPAPLSRHLLEDAARAPALTTNTDEDSHGMKVVEYFLKHDGLLRLEEYWREHFLDSMEPKYMPELWSTKHNEERLRVRFDEGRLSDKDLHLIGLAKWA